MPALYLQLVLLCVCAVRLAMCACVRNTSKPVTVLQCTSVDDFLRYENGSLARVEINCEKPFTLPEGSSNFTAQARERLENVTHLSVRHCGQDVFEFLREANVLRLLNLTDNNLNSVRWNDLRFHNSLVDLRSNPLDCRKCANRWLTHGPWSRIPTKSSGKSSEQQRRRRPGWDPRQVLSLPDRIMYDAWLDNCTFEHCPDETVQFEEHEVNTTLGTNAELHCSLSGYHPSSASNASEPPISPFRWLLEKEFTVESEEETMNATRRNFTFTATRSGGMAAMQLAPVASEDLGSVACICDACVGPEFDQAEIRFPANLTAELHDGDREAVLIVHGYPLTQVEMSVRRVSDNVTEKHALSNEKTYFFDATFSVEYVKDHSEYFLKYYSIYIHECSDCHHIHLDGHYEIRLCTEDSCATVNNTFHNANYAEKITRIHVDNSPSSTSGGLLHAFPIIILFLMATAVTMGLLALRFKRRLAKAGWEIKHRRISRYTERTDETSIRLSNMDSMDTFSTSASSYMIQHVPVIESDQIELKEKIGKGAFGEVFVADWREHGIKVAVKMLHNVQMDAEMDKEAALLAQMEHENVVKLFGIWRCDNQLTLVLEMMSLGDLKNYLRQRKPSHNDYCQFPPSLLETELINICIQICSGLCYIASQQIVHRDLASRNCLVTGESDLKACSAAFRPPVTVKISDFGMSRKLYPDVEYYRMQDKRTALPVRWLPPECLSTGKFTHQSDIWSFGVTLSEVFSYGEMPFGNLSNSEVLSAVMSGMRPSIPSKCPFEICQIIADCWHESPTQRLTADEALTRLKMIQNH